MDGLFAGTPPLEALRYLIHEAAAVRPDEKIGSKVLMINDVARAFFEAPATRNLCVELPEEDKEEGEGDMVGKLEMSLYGTRDASANFQKEVKEFMLRIGFRQGRYNPCTFWHPERGITRSRRRLRSGRHATAIEMDARSIRGKVRAEGGNPWAG